MVMEEERKKLGKMYQELNEEDTNIKKWNQALIPKAILLFPPIAFVLTFLKIKLHPCELIFTDKYRVILYKFLTVLKLLNRLQ